MCISALGGASGYKRMDNADFFGMDIFSVYTPDPLKCLASCERVPDCRVATWWEDACYLKTSLSNETYKQDAVSFVMYPEDITCDNSETYRSKNMETCALPSRDSMPGSLPGDVQFPTDLPANETSPPEPVTLMPDTPAPVVTSKNLTTEEPTEGSGAGRFVVASTACSLLAVTLASAQAFVLL